MKNIPVYFYKKSTFQYIVLTVMAFIAGSTMIWFSTSDGVLFGALFFMLIVVFIAARICTKTAMKLTLELDRILVEELDPERYIAEMDQKALRRDPAKQQPQLRLFRANAYRLMGKYKESEEIYVDFLKRLPKTAKDDSVNIQYILVYSSLSLLYSSAGSFETAEKAYNKAREQAKGLTQDDHIRALLEYPYYALLANNGETAEAIDYYKKRSTDAPTAANRVIGHFKLGEAYEAAGYDELALEEYRFVAENGGKLYIAQLAAEKI